MRLFKKIFILISVLSIILLFTGCQITIESSNEGNKPSESVITIDQLERTDYFRKGAIAHILEGELNSRGQAVGYHYDRLPSKKGEIIPGTKTEENEFGVYEAEVIVQGVKKESNSGRSSFFPDHWNAQEVIDAINEAYESKQFLHGNTYEGMTEEGIIIRMYLDNSEKIISAFPLY